MSEKNQIEPARRLQAHIQSDRLEAGLYLVATPIGAARDITLRALDVLNCADMLAAEDTRVMRHLMDIHGVPLRGRRILSYHDHNADRARPALMQALKEGASVAYASDAGTPLVADPGYRLARDAAEEGARVHVVPGPSAALAALSLSGLPSDRFLFAGFPPATKGARTTWLRQWASLDATVILFESPRRVNQTLKQLCEIDPDRVTVVARELTKKFEEVIRGTARELADDPRMASLKGEVVMLLDRGTTAEVKPVDLNEALTSRLGRMTVKDAAREVANELGLARRDVYQTALELAREAQDRDE
ncbi:16S rRNA (cytidine(1402)-2'-O)-methyltransferase [Paracoccus seriniphilus]|uniref:Ribosomal RNA small subunit methyltransferase I n=1 Tax=Paracoccus seriniphilus TaxID=184748 RepID=A0A239PW22_9RHOB|nr:16S rRNA (cytidine(1402)-2'-O)-methyltransferase [Paracoccus seriniphilus]WCR13403.1 16S rRNA (cytidine(1402)-2'-O)-methyltransferase [Paracoccus seriniphilus]SNT74350.1 16S rRNA (cytidine1402-2'-O)-methyltransferase [Paracoccus seriniphilus]